MDDIKLPSGNEFMVGLDMRMPSARQASPAIPTALNLGSGKDYRSDLFNIDIDDTWAPDAIVDLSVVDIDHNGVVVPTGRFGDVTLKSGMFDKIITNDVLEHVPNLVKFMTNCLQLLKIGGTFEISVPYDLSYGAWQDPTHLRAFNERSWLYYTDWFWYLGWGEARFIAEKISYTPSPYGQELLQKGMNQEDVRRQPRAIDQMFARLRKIELTEQDKQMWRHWRERREEAAKRNIGRTGAAANIPVSAAAPTAQRHLNIATATMSAPAPVAAAPIAAPVPSIDLTAPFAGGWAKHSDSHCVWIVSPEGYQHSHAFDEVAETLSNAFAELGGSAPLVRHPSEWQGRSPIIFGANLLSAEAANVIPASSIIVNLEQAQQDSAWMKGHYIDMLKRFPVFDYSGRNRQALQRFGVGHANLLPVGYTRSLTRIRHRPVKDIDVLFYGSMNERRHEILHALGQRGLNVIHLFDVYGEERDSAIARSKIVLNMHYYETAIFEVVRVSYLLANGVCVVTEGEAGDPDIAPFADGLAIAPHSALVERCMELIADDRQREALAMRGFKIMSSRWQADLIKPLL
ncbi:methyltransferase domain-containing protein [Rhizobium sp. S152]|uniref:methyltransferase domain-containing protein n=1 Tax=Rhizobium sp. S152 TaxID=3055038 RepID=UPI0025A9505E|nr:methyltransferase domain-containing protein [Rhizobium sp. S152]MDM9628410.1 methyltransferase domain-containing protein [Rhizobium sp. S152]